MMSYQNDTYQQPYDSGENWSCYGQSWGGTYVLVPYDQRSSNLEVYDCSWDYQQQGHAYQQHAYQQQGDAYQQQGDAYQQQGWGSSHTMDSWGGSNSNMNAQAPAWVPASDTQAPQTQQPQQLQQPQQPQQLEQLQQPQHSWYANNEGYVSSRWPEASMMSYVEVPQTGTSPTQAFVPVIMQPVQQVAMSGFGRTPQAAEETETGSDELIVLRQSELKRLMARDGDVPCSTSQERSLQKEKVDQASDSSVVPTSRGASSSEACPVPQQDTPKTETAVSAPATPESSVKPGEVKSHRALVDFAPRNRNYGEMHVTAGEEVTVRYPPTEDWIFGWKGWPARDQGWIPAQCLGIGVNFDNKDDEAPQAVQAVPAAPAVQEPTAGQRFIMAFKKQEQAHGPQKQTIEEKAKPKDDVETWHQHGNWWSKQRHLKTPQETPAPVKKDIGDVRRRPPTNPEELQQASRIVSNAFAAAITNKESRTVIPLYQKQKEAQPTAGAKGNGRGGGRGGGRGSGPERPHRERRALSNLLNRLQEPIQISHAQAP